jgi:ParB-like chromosome segregation protein Spo0J
MGQSHLGFRSERGTTCYVAIDDIFVSRKKLRKLSDAKITQYAQAYEGGEEFPPISVDDNGGFYTIFDGRHRYQAQLRAGFTLVAVSVR